MHLLVRRCGIGYGTKLESVRVIYLLQHMHREADGVADWLWMFSTTLFLLTLDFSRWSLFYFYFFTCAAGFEPTQLILCPKLASGEIIPAN